MASFRIRIRIFLFLAFFSLSLSLHLDAMDGVDCLLSMDNALLAAHTLFLNSNGEERFRCPLCSSVQYTQVRYLRSHVKECGLRFYCELCQQVYRQKRTYKNHMRSKHNQCGALDASFTHKLSKS